MVADMGTNRSHGEPHACTVHTTSLPPVRCRLTSMPRTLLPLLLFQVSEKILYQHLVEGVARSRVDAKDLPAFLEDMKPFNLSK